MGNRISIKYTRALLTAALTGKLSQVEYIQDPVFGFEIPKSCPDVPASVLEPWSSWSSRADYDRKYHELAVRFVENFRKFEDGMPAEVIAAGPKI